MSVEVEVSSSEVNRLSVEVRVSSSEGETSTSEVQDLSLELEILSSEVERSPSITFEVRRRSLLQVKLLSESE
ncbi:MAG TPA: hypothetical protein V6C65_04935 [Allocoleopsis sp.]